MNDADQIDDRTGSAARAGVTPSKNLADLKPKGACWYCNQPLDNIRRFCSKTCANDYLTEEEAFNKPQC